MAVKTRKTKPTTRVYSAPKTKRRRTPVSRKATKSSGALNFIVPVVLLLAILAGIGFLVFKGYQTVTASSFFTVKRIDVKGNSRISSEAIERIVRNHTTSNGTWNAELSAIKTDIERPGDEISDFKNVTVARILPDGIQVTVDERVPRAVVRMSNGDFWVDEDAVKVAAVAKVDAKLPFVMTGWKERGPDRDLSEKELKENRERVRIYTKLRSDAQAIGAEKRINSINLIDLNDAEVYVEDSGYPVKIQLGKEDHGKRLQTALTVVEGKGETIGSLIAHGAKVVSQPRKTKRD